MNRLRVIFAAILLVALMLIVVGCGQSTTENTNDTAEEKSGPVSVQIGTSPSGGTFYTIGVKMADIVNKEVDGYQVTAQPTDGAVDNIKRMSLGELDLGFTYSANIVWARNAEEMFDKKYPLNLIVTGHSAPWILVVREDSGIEHWDDLKGKRIAGPPTGGLNGWKIFYEAIGYYGIKEEDLKSAIRSSNLNDVVEQIKNDKLDGILWPCAKGGVPAFIDLANATDIKWLGMDEDLIEHMIEVFPFVAKITVPAGSNEDQDEDVTTVASLLQVFASDALDEEVAYTLTKTIVENLNQIKDLMPAGEEWTPERAIASREFLPYHPGAERYYKESGIWK